MSVTQNEVQKDISEAIAAAVAKVIDDDGLRRSITQYLINAQMSQPVEERTSALIESILEKLSEEER